MFQDSYKQKGKRIQLIKELENQGIDNQKVLKALMQVPRHFFFPTDFEEKAYDNIAFPIDAGQTISQPFTVAFQTQLLDIQTGQKVLEIGTGSGYQAAVLKVMGADVITVETIMLLHQQAIELFPRLGLNIHAVLGDGSKGFEKEAPYDRILVTAAAPELSDKLVSQLKPGGKLVAPVGKRDVQKMILVQRIGENEYSKSEHGQFTFVPLRGTYGWQK